MKVITLLLYVSVGVQASVFDAVLHWTGALIRRDDAPECKQYTVKANDTCFSIMRTTNATYAQLISWNDAIDGQCS